MPLGPGQAATIPLRVCGVPGCVSVALTLSYQSAPDSLYGRELALPGLRLRLLDDETRAPPVVGAPSLAPRIDGGEGDSAGQLTVRWELLAAGRAAGGGAARAEGRPLPTVSAAQGAVPPPPTAGPEAPQRWAWEASSYQFYELRLIVEAAAGERLTVHLDGGGLEGCSCSGAMDYQIEGQGEGPHVHSLGLFFTRAAAAVVEASIVDSATGRSHTDSARIAVVEG